MVYLTDEHGGDRVCFSDELIPAPGVPFRFQEVRENQPRGEHPHFFVDLAKRNVKRRRAHLGASGEQPVVRKPRRKPAAVILPGRIRFKDAAVLAGVSGALLSHHVSAGALKTVTHSKKCVTFDEVEFRAWMEARGAAREAAKTVTGLTVNEVCALTNAEAATVRSAVQEGRLAGVKAGNQWRFKLPEVERWNRENRHRGYARKNLTVAATETANDLQRQAGHGQTLSMGRK
jgi:excisionase family DNA binding protein